VCFVTDYWMNILHFEYRGAPVIRVHGRCECYTGQGVVGIAKSTLKFLFYVDAPTSNTLFGSPNSSLAQVGS